MRAPEAGVTLVEILVVLAIVAVMAGMAVLAIGVPDGGGRAETEARRFANRLGLAVDEALVTGRPLALNWEDRGYLFAVRNESADVGQPQWHPSPVALLGSRHAVPDSVEVRADGAHDAVMIEPDGAGLSLDVVFAAGAVAWRVAFDGLSSSVVRVER